MIPSRPSKYWILGWAVSPRSLLSSGIDWLRVFDFCSKLLATTSGSAAVKYLRRAFVKLDASPFSLSFWRMSYVVTRLIFEFLAICETTLVPVSSSAR